MKWCKFTFFCVHCLIKSSTTSYYNVTFRITARSVNIKAIHLLLAICASFCWSGLLHIQHFSEQFSEAYVLDALQKCRSSLDTVSILKSNQQTCTTLFHGAPFPVIFHEKKTAAASGGVLANNLVFMDANITPSTHHRAPPPESLMNFGPFELSHGKGEKNKTKQTDAGIPPEPASEVIWWRPAGEHLSLLALNYSKRFTLELTRTFCTRNCEFHAETNDFF